MRCTAAYDTCFVGREKRSRCLDCTLVARMGDNYRLETSDLVLKTTDKSPPTAGLPKVCCIGQGAFLDLRTLFSDAWKGEARFQLTGEALGCTLQGTTLTAGRHFGTVSCR